ncbi:hypothetical protein CF326_g10035 [Tilletia indica]|nr:hypothetical protein CF326_g10035 [Tilletia indica]
MEGGTSGGVPMGPSYAVRSGSLPLSPSGHVDQGISTSTGGAATVRKDPRRTSYLLSPTESATSSNVSSSDATSVSGGGGGSGGQTTTVLSPVQIAAIVHARAGGSMPSGPRPPPGASREEPDPRPVVERRGGARHLMGWTRLMCWTKGNASGSWRSWRWSSLVGYGETSHQYTML